MSCNEFLCIVAGCALGTDVCHWMFKQKSTWFRSKGFPSTWNLWLWKAIRFATFPQQTSVQGLMIPGSLNFLYMSTGNPELWPVAFKNSFSTTTIKWLQQIAVVPIYLVTHVIYLLEREHQSQINNSINNGRVLESSFSRLLYILGVYSLADIQMDFFIRKRRHNGAGRFTSITLSLHVMKDKSPDKLSSQVHDLP